MTRAVTQVTAEDLAAWWPVPGADSHKYTRGVVGIDTGSEDYPGAALLSIAGALGAGPGMARYLGTAPRDLILGRFPSVVLVPGQVQALVVGSGWGQRPDAEARLSGAVSRGVPLLVDADALQLLPAHLPPESLLTPHAGELARMLSMRRAEVEADPVAAAREAARAFGCAVLLKGASGHPGWGGAARDPGAGLDRPGRFGGRAGRGLRHASRGRPACVASRSAGSQPPGIDGVAFPGATHTRCPGSAVSRSPGADHTT